MADNVTFCSIRIKFSVLSNQSLTFGNRIDLITQTIGRAVNQIVVSPAPCLSVVISILICSIVVQSLIPHLIILLRTVDHLIVWCSTMIGTPLSINCDNSILTLLCALGCNHDDTITTTSTI